ncbi:hypothetical protein HYW44_03565 [Candidatus Daviesbacteria bacterium]|nr:hypothetical protein [Candidatus Daviesbacteria bacterium]
MRPLNLLFTLASINVLVITIERFSFTTGILLEPFQFIRLHELLQGPVFLTISVVLSFLTLKIVSDNFKGLNTKTGLILGSLFVAGIYLYGMGEGWHEIASFTFNQYCDTKNFSDNLCGGLFINDYYTGNILFFIGGILMNGSLIFLEMMNPSKVFGNKDMSILFVNSFVYAFTFFAYAGFDRVLVGLYSTLILMIIALYAFAKIKDKFRNYPYITYSALSYTLASIASIIVRLR